MLKATSSQQLTPMKDNPHTTPLHYQLVLQNQFQPTELDDQVSRPLEPSRPFQQIQPDHSVKSKKVAIANPQDKSSLAQSNPTKTISSIPLHKPPQLNSSPTKVHGPVSTASSAKIAPAIPSFEVLTKTDIARNLRHVLKARSQPMPDTQQSLVQITTPKSTSFGSVLDTFFGPGDPNRGIGKKPRTGKIVRIGDAYTASTGSRASSMAADEGLFGSRKRLLSRDSGDEDGSRKRARVAEADRENGEVSATAAESRLTDSQLASVWTKTLTQVIKAKTVLSPEAMENASLTLHEVEVALPGMDEALAESSGLRECIRQLSTMDVEQIAKEDEYGLVMRAKDLAEALTA